MSLVHLSAPTPAVLTRAHAATLTGLLAAAGVIHLAAAPEHSAEYLLFGLAFYAMAVLQLLASSMFAAGAVSERLRMATIDLNLAIALLWVTTRLVGLPIGPEPWHAEAVGVQDAVCTLIELVAVAVLVRARGSVAAQATGVEAT